MSDEKKVNLTEKIKNPYSSKYRILKTILMIYAWVSFGLNLEPIGVALEDLRILLNVDYQSISIAFVSRNISYMIVTLFIGFIMDKLINYSEFFMAFGKLLIILPNFILPWSRIYTLSMGLFLLQGVGHALYDVGGNQIIMRLWSGISESPVSAMHAGYGIGAMIILQILKPYLKFNPQENENYENNTNFSLSFNHTLNRTNLTSNDIKLQIPYGIAGLIGVLTIILFIIAQFFEFKQIKKSEYLKEPEEYPLKEHNEKNIKENLTIYEKIFGFNIINNRDLVIVSIELLLIVFIFMAVSAYNTVLTAYMLTYAMKGPAKFLRDEFLIIQTVFWIIFILGRFTAALLGFKLNSFYFFNSIIILNTILAGVFVTKLNEIKSFYWFIILASGLLNGPLIPCCFATAKFVFVKTSAFLVSVFCIGLGVGGLLSTYITGVILDKFKPSDNWFGYKNPDSTYIIPLILFTISIFGALCTIIALIIYSTNKNAFSLEKKK